MVPVPELQAFLQQLEGALGCPCRLTQAPAPWHAATDGLLRCGRAGEAGSAARALALSQLEACAGENGYVNFRFTPAFLSRALLFLASLPREGSSHTLQAAQKALARRQVPADVALSRPDDAARLLFCALRQKHTPAVKEALRRQTLVLTAEALRAPLTDEMWLYLSVLCTLCARLAI